MPDDLDLSISFDNRLDSYASFFDHEWAARFLDAVEPSLLKPAGFLLCRDWKGVALASRMSWLLVEAMDIYQRTIWQHKPPDPKRMLKALVEHVTKDAGIRHMARQKIIEGVHSLDQQFEESLRNAAPPVDRETMWHEYLQVKEMPWALWASQWLAYAAIYFSYENFLRATVGIAKQGPHYRTPRAVDFHRDVAQVFGTALADSCISAEPITVARLARNCIAHNGGRESQQLKRAGHRIRVENGYLQIYPEDLRGLYHELKDRVLAVADRARELAVFCGP